MGKMNMPDPKPRTSNLGVPLYKPMPFKTGETHTNELIIPLFQPSRWAFFKPTPEAVERFGYRRDFQLTIGGEPLATFYFPLFAHNIQGYVREDGTSGFASVVCPVQLNAYCKSMFGKDLFDKIWLIDISLRSTWRLLILSGKGIWFCRFQSSKVL